MKITLTVFNKLYSHATKAFAEETFINLQNWSYGISCKQDTRKSRLLFLYTYALSSWEQDEMGNYEHKVNFLTEEQVGSIVARIKELG